MPEGQLWETKEFLARLDAWVERERPPDYQRLAATAWVLSRIDNPYIDAIRAEGFANLWYSVVPGTIDVRGRAVVCSFWIHEATRTVVCDSFAVLGWPV